MTESDTPTADDVSVTVVGDRVHVRPVPLATNFHRTMGGAVFETVRPADSDGPDTHVAVHVGRGGDVSTAVIPLDDFAFAAGVVIDDA